MGYELIVATRFVEYHISTGVVPFDGSLKVLRMGVLRAKDQRGIEKT